MINFLLTKKREYIFIILTVTIFSLFTSSKSFSEENVFIIDNVKVEGAIDINFSRDKYINKAFLDSYKILMPRVLLARDLNKIFHEKVYNTYKKRGVNMATVDKLTNYISEI